MSDFSDLAVEAFRVIRSHFFDSSRKPIPFHLRPKHNTQDDPFDEYLATQVLSSLIGIECRKAPGPLITPDIVLFRPEYYKGAGAEVEYGPAHIVALEVKKLERTPAGGVARSSGLDYNTTPPCGKVRVYDITGKRVDIPGYYLFVCLEQVPGSVVLTALVLADGNILNADFELYLSIVGEREKQISLGSYGDGANRQRPMLIFSNPLGVAELDYYATLIHAHSNLQSSGLRQVYRLERTLQRGGTNTFYCYRAEEDVPPHWEVQLLRDPFPTPVRETRTRRRGIFKI